MQQELLRERVEQPQELKLELELPVGRPEAPAAQPEGRAVLRAEAQPEGLPGVPAAWPEPEPEALPELQALLLAVP